LCFTGVALIYWGTFDSQYTRDEFKKDPSLYRIGIEKKEFNPKKYWGWYTFGFYQAGVILFLGMICTQMEGPDGKTFDFWSGGHVIYGMTIMYSNVVLLQMTNNWTGWGEFLIIGQWLSYYPFLWGDAFIDPKNVVYQFFQIWFENPYHWGCNLAAFAMVTFVDFGFYKVGLLFMS
jgi:magnesium-transporting ATPase (P-type)